MEPENAAKPNKTFEECLPIIIKEISRKRPKWQLTSLNFLDYDDVANMLLKHVFIKWDKYDQSRPLLNWLHGLLNNRIKNIIRDNYGAWKRPCLTCPHFGGGSVCDLFGVQSEECLDFDKWAKTKRFKLELLMTSSTDAPRDSEEGEMVHIQLEDKTCNFLDFETKIPEFQALLKQKLRPLEWRAYTYLFIDHMTDIQCAKQLGYDTTGNKNSKGYKTVLKIKTKIYKVSQLIVKDMEF